MKLEFPDRRQGGVPALRVAHDVESSVPGVRVAQIDLQHFADSSHHVHNRVGQRISVTERMVLARIRTPHARQIGHGDSKPAE